MTEFSDKNRLANLIIAGVNKAGSTSLFHYLSSHPDICGSRDKETCYFLPLLYKEPLGPLSDYSDQFAHCNNSVYRMEATPAYIFGGEKIAVEIIQTLGKIKILIILKNPVYRLVSFFQRKKTTFQLPEDITLAQYIERCMEYSREELSLKENQVYTGISLGQYHEYLEPWLQLFGDQIKVVFFDALKMDTRSFMKDICEWLEIDKSFYDTFEFDIKNKSFNYRNKLIHKMAVTANNAGQRFWRANPSLKKSMLGIYYKMNGGGFSDTSGDEAALNFLHAHYRPHNIRLQSLLTKYGIGQLPQWLEHEKETV